MGATRSTLDELLARYDAMSPAQRQDFEKTVVAGTADMRWVPNPGPQTQAYQSEADVLLFGGEPGGGKTQLLVGLAYNTSDRALLVRRQYTDLDFVIESALKVHGSRDGYSGKPPPSLVHAGGRIDFGAAARAGDEQRHMGKPRDLMGVDEATQFTFSQIRFFQGWIRSDKPGQRCRMVLATNPPLSSEGAWVLVMFAPWLDPKFPDPAQPGELRWCIFDQDDDQHWVDGPGEYELANGEKRYAQSYTFIPSGLADNPAYDEAEYRKRLDALPAEIRAILLGGFRTSFRDHPQQVIPTAWVQAAFERHKLGRPHGVPMVAIGVDPTGGGNDPLVIAPRYDWWYAPLTSVPGSSFNKLKLGRQQAGYIAQVRRDGAKVGIDVGGGYASGIIEACVDNFEEGTILGLNGAERSTARTRDGKLGFANQRAERYWKLREALDPDQDPPPALALPESPTLLADLTALNYELTSAGLKVTPKVARGEDTDSVTRRLGRSPNEGDAVVNAWAVGERLVPKGQGYRRPGRKAGHIPATNLGPRHRRRG